MIERGLAALASTSPGSLEDVLLGTPLESCVPLVLLESLVTAESVQLLTVSKMVTNKLDRDEESCGLESSRLSDCCSGLEDRHAPRTRSRPKITARRCFGRKRPNAIGFMVG